ncbi:MAG: hypothetical protein ACTSXJ_05060 [Candidatus Baldrarchaeia archaeon]
MMIPRDREPAPPEVFLEEAQRIVDVLEENGIVARVMGAVAIRLHSMDFADLHKRLERLGPGQPEFSDLDFMTYSKHRKNLRKIMEKELGYICDLRILHLAGWKRHIYYHKKWDFHVDFFFDKLEMAHDIDFRGRLEVDRPTIPLAEMLMEKLQIVQINEKDIKDSIVLLRAHQIGNHDDDVINATRIATVLADDWGFWYTATTNLNKIKVFAQKYKENGLLSEEDLKDVTSKVDQLLKIIDETPKTKRWRKRAKQGTKKKWYRDVEEVVR